jgi:hypothetical protein
MLVRPGGHRILAKYDDEAKPVAKLQLTGEEDGDNAAPQPIRRHFKPAMVRGGGGGVYEKSSP